jgi:leucyl/phenylalanyl-tRNA--protein transferase
MPNKIPFLEHPDAFPTHQDILRGAPSFDGVYAISLDIDATWVKTAYMRGLFPWFSDGQPVLWHSPEPRMVLPVAQFKCAPSLKKRLKQWARHPLIDTKVTLNHAFEQVIKACADSARAGQSGTWITDELRSAYTQLHQQQNAVSVEVWQDGVLVAGLYGVLIGRMFFGESMFTTVSDGSKVALACWVDYLNRCGGTLIDCQQVTTHLASMGGAPITQAAFFEWSAQLMAQEALDFAAMAAQPNLLSTYAT